MMDIVDCYIFMGFLLLYYISKSEEDEWWR